LSNVNLEAEIVCRCRGSMWSVASCLNYLCWRTTMSESP